MLPRPDRFILKSSIGSNFLFIVAPFVVVILGIGIGFLPDEIFKESREDSALPLPPPEIRVLIGSGFIVIAIVLAFFLFMKLTSKVTVTGESIYLTKWFGKAKLETSLKNVKNIELTFNGRTKIETRFNNWKDNGGLTVSVTHIDENKFTVKFSGISPFEVDSFVEFIQEKTGQDAIYKDHERIAAPKHTWNWSF